jgi:hypothetical protein
LAEQRQEFETICRQHSLSECEANFNVWRSTNSIAGLASASEAEIAQYRQEAISARNERLLQADTRTLKTLARREGAETQTTAAQQQADREFEAATIRDAAVGYPSLPELWRGQKLNAEFIRRADVSTLKFLRQRFGTAAIDARLRGIS